MCACLGNTGRSRVGQHVASVGQLLHGLSANTETDALANIFSQSSQLGLLGCLVLWVHGHPRDVERCLGVAARLAEQRRLARVACGQQETLAMNGLRATHCAVPVGARASPSDWCMTDIIDEWAAYGHKWDN